MKWVQRTAHARRVVQLLRERPVVALLGARRVGKTTLARQIVAGWRGAPTFFDLEDPRDLRELTEPTLALAPLRGLVVLDEVQLRPDLFGVLRVLADRPRTPARFLVLGSASPALLRQGAETLAGRIGFHELAGFDLGEVGGGALERLWFRGAFPESFGARSHRASRDWRRDFVRTFLERDLPRLGLTVPAATLDRFWAMLAHYHGQVWNASELARSLGVSHTTVGHYLHWLRGAFVVDELPPWFANVAKRQVKAPKIYLTDSGLLHTLLGIETPRDLWRHPKLGASWEGFAMRQVARVLGAQRHECFFWATHAGAELDLLVVRGERRLGFEIKRTDTPTVTASMRSALAALALERLDVIHAGRRTYPLAANIRAVAAERMVTDLPPLGR